MDPKSSSVPAAMQGAGYDIRHLYYHCKEKEFQKCIMKLKSENFSLQVQTKEQMFPSPGGLRSSQVKSGGISSLRSYSTSHS